MLAMLTRCFIFFFMTNVTFEIAHFPALLVSISKEIFAAEREISFQAFFSDSN